MRSSKRLLLTALFSVFSMTVASAADIVVAPAPAPQAVVREASSCLRWVWQESSWYDDCWWQRHPYVGRSVPVVRRVRN
jgi:hypothetical protein